ncbi:MAG TPA: hypothetical protein VED40_01305 [Azospirillaceae bacterium]|nr:hypothetical protein [Azospirillaceae bacterium]
MTTPPPDQNLAPVNTVPGTTRSATTGQALGFTGGNQVQIADGTANATMTVTLTAANGTVAVTGTGGTAIGSGTATLTITGTVEQVNTRLATLTFTGTAAGAATITVATVDGEGLRDDDTINLTVADAVNLAPVNTVPGATQSATAGTSAAIAGVSLNDPEDAASIAVTLTATNGTVAVTGTGGTVTGSGTATLSIEGTEAQVNARLGTLSFTGMAAGAATITLASSDKAGGTDTDVINITVASAANTPPVNAVPSTTVEAVLNVSKAITGVSVDDPENASTITVTLAPTNGTIAVTGTGGTVTPGTNGALMISGTETQVNDRLATLTFTGTAGGSAAISVTSADGAGGTDTDTINITVATPPNTAPVNTVPGSTLAATSGQGTAVAGLSVADADTGATLTVTLTPSNGTVTANANGGGATIGTATGNAVTVSGSVAAVNTALTTVSFTGRAQGSGSITVKTSDGAGGEDTDVVNFAVTNNAPVNTLPGIPTVTAGTATAITGITVDDPEANSAMTVTLSSTNGTIAATTGAATVTASNGNTTLVIAGTEAAVNTALGTLKFNGTAAGEGRITVVTDDGAGASDSDTLTITVNAAPNVAPVTTVPGATLSGTVNSALAFTGGNAISVSDGNAGDTITMEFSSAGGKFAASGSGVTGSGTGALTLIGTQSAVNTLLAGVSFTPDAAGDATITISTSDGAGGTDSDKISVTVAASAPTTGGGGGGDDTPANPGSGTTTTTVGNTTVTTQQQTDSSGAQVVTTTVAPVPAGSATPVSVPLSTAGGTTVLAAELPAGTGLAVTGRSEAQAPAGAATALSGEVTRLVSDASIRTEIGTAVTGYVGTLPSNATVTVRTMTPSVTGTTAPTAPIVISGQAGGTGATAQEALVIDTRGLPSGTVIQLRDVEFAVLVGPVSATGGDGSNYVVGDGSPQQIVLGPDDDTLRGGAGDDTVGSGAGADLIFGDEGADRLFGGAGDDTLTGGGGSDTVVLSGARGDYLVTAGASGTVIRQVNGTTDGTDLVVGVETAAFAGGSASLAELAAREMLVQRADGLVVSWNQVAGSAGFRPLLQIGPDASVQGAGDFNADGRGDLLFRHSSGVTLWWNVAQGAQGFTQLLAVPADARVRTGDFQGSAASDLLVERTDGRLSYVDAGTGAETQLFGMSAGTSLIAVADLDGTGRDEILFRTDATGGVYAWNGQSFVDLLTLPSGWSVTGTGNFLGSAADDLLLFNGTSRVLLFWDATQGAAGFRDFITLPTGWSLTGFGDVNGDGYEDVVIRNDQTGAGVYWTGTAFGDLGTVLQGLTLLGVTDLTT